MYDSRLLPHEQRRLRRPKLEETLDDNPPASRSVRSIRQRFENNSTSKPSPSSAPTTPAKRHNPITPKTTPTTPTTPATTNTSSTNQSAQSRKQTYSEAELLAFLKRRPVMENHPAKTHPVKPPLTKAPHPTKEAPQNASVGSLIAKWGGDTARRTLDDRPPLQERDPQHVELPAASKKPIVDSVDTFGSSADFENAIPKTDPGPRLNAFANNLQHADVKSPTASAAEAVATGDQNLRDMVARGIQHRSARETVTHKVEHDVRTPDPPRESNRKESGETSEVAEEVGEAANSDWGAGDVYIRELFAEAEETAERAVQCDENEEYFEAFELYWVVVDLYYKIIPFLSPEEGEDVHERIKMYTRRCGLIREAFEDDPEGQGHLEDLVADATLVSAQKETQIQESFNTGKWNSHHRNLEVEQVRHAEPAGQYPLAAMPAQEASPTSVEETAEDKGWIKEQSKSRYFGEEEQLQRNRFPDYSNSKPLSAIPEAPRNPNTTALSASTKAHRNSLSRPISRSAVRASTSSISRERVAEMQERVQVMQECLNNFTVKRKHLGPARALELHVTTLNANTFGDLKKLEPLAPELEHKWATELEVLLSMLQEIKEVRPGVGYGLREDIARHLPALERCDRSVRKTMCSFSALAGHVQYVERETGSGSAKGGRGRRRWWVKVPVVRKGGLPREIRRIVREAEEEMRGVFKVCHEINVEVVKTMPVPASFVDGLPKHARSLIPRELKEGLTTWGMFKVSDYMKDRNLWNKDAAKEITSSLEKVALIWEAKTSNKSFLSRTFDIRGERFQQAVTAFRRCQNAIRDLRREWPTMQHTDLDMAKIQNNEDIGHAGLEAYSRALESRAYRLLSRIRELLDADEEQKVSSTGRARPSAADVH